MSAEPLTKAEKAWLKKLQDVMNECPSKRISAYTIGDSNISFYDNRYDLKIDEIQNKSNTDFGPACDHLGAYLGLVFTPFPVHSTAG